MRTIPTEKEILVTHGFIPGISGLFAGAPGMIGIGPNFNR